MSEALRHYKISVGRGGNHQWQIKPLAKIAIISVYPAGEGYQPELADF
jgi:hypothetical protein